jgi:hypothetical protein
MLFKKTVAVYCENHTEHTDTLRGQSVLKLVVYQLLGFKSLNNGIKLNYYYHHRHHCREGGGTLS